MNQYILLQSRNHDFLKEKIYTENIHHTIKELESSEYVLSLLKKFPEQVNIANILLKNFRKYWRNHISNIDEKKIYRSEQQKFNNIKRNFLDSCWYILVSNENDRIKYEEYFNIFILNFPILIELSIDRNPSNIQYLSHNHSRYEKYCIKVSCLSPDNLQYVKYPTYAMYYKAVCTNYTSLKYVKNQDDTKYKQILEQAAKTQTDALLYLPPEYYTVENIEIFTKSMNLPEAPKNSNLTPLEIIAYRLFFGKIGSISIPLLQIPIYSFNLKKQIIDDYLLHKKRLDHYYFIREAVDTLSVENFNLDFLEDAKINELISRNGIWIKCLTEKKKSKELCYLSTKTANTLKWIPSEYCNEDFYHTAALNYIYSIPNIPNNYINSSLLEKLANHDKAVERMSWILHKIPSLLQFVTPELARKILLKDITSTPYLKKYLTQELCLEIVNTEMGNPHQRKRILQHVPVSLLTYQICLIHTSCTPNDLPYVPVEFRDKKLCLQVCMNSHLTDWWSITDLTNSIPINIIDQELVDVCVNKFPNSLIYFDAQFHSQDLCKKYLTKTRDINFFTKMQKENQTLDILLSLDPFDAKQVPLHLLESFQDENTSKQIEEKNIKWTIFLNPEKYFLSWKRLLEMKFNNYYWPEKNCWIGSLFSSSDFFDSNNTNMKNMKNTFEYLYLYSLKNKIFCKRCKNGTRNEFCFSYVNLNLEHTYSILPTCQFEIKKVFFRKISCIRLLTFLKACKKYNISSSNQQINDILYDLPFDIVKMVISKYLKLSNYFINNFVIDLFLDRYSPV
jgi:hypothetical protein